VLSVSNSWGTGFITQPFMEHYMIVLPFIYRFWSSRLTLRYSGLMNQAPTYRDRDVAPTKEAIHELPLLHY